MDDEILDNLNYRNACRWRAARIERFVSRQQKERAWICFSEIAERYARESSRSKGYEELRRSVVAGEFEQNGRSRVLYLHVSGVRPKMTRERMANVTDTFQHSKSTIERQYLACCWIPHDMAIRWCIKNNISRAGWLDGAPTLDGAASKSDQPLDRAEDISLDKRRLIDKPPRPTQHQERKAYQFFGSCRAENPEIFSKTLADIQEFARQKGHNFSTSVIHRVLVRA